MADLGLDLAGVDDISPNLATVSGRRALIQAIARRLITPRGGLFYDPDYGFDLRQFLSGITASPGAIASGAAAEAEKDERVDQASAVVAFSGNALMVKLAIADGADGAGPFTFTIAVSKVSVELLTQG